MEIIAYEMQYSKPETEKCEIECISFEQQYFPEYMRIYNACFYEMRKALGIEPYHYLSGYEQIRDKSMDIFLLVKDGEMIGSVACHGNEIDDLIVDKRFQNKGYGKQLLLWGMHCIRHSSKEPIILHVAKWNERAWRLYEKVGFEITAIETVR